MPTLPAVTIVLNFMLIIPWLFKKSATYVLFNFTCFFLTFYKWDHWIHGLLLTFNMFLRLIHVDVCSCKHFSFCLKNKPTVQYSCGKYTGMYFSPHFGRHLGCFQVYCYYEQGYIENLIFTFSFLHFCFKQSCFVVVI